MLFAPLLSGWADSKPIQHLYWHNRSRSRDQSVAITSLPGGYS